MSTEPLLPSYASAARRPWSQHDDQPNGDSEGIFISATPIIQWLSLLIFVVTATVSTLWAFRSNISPDPTPPASAPLLPYFASLCLIISLGCWVGYLVFISYDAAGGPKLQRKIIIYTSAVGKLVLAGAHIGIGLSYAHYFPDSVQPKWVVVFLAAQAWWDLLLFVIYSLLR